MNRILTVLTALLAAGLLSGVIILRSCAPAATDGVLLAINPSEIHMLRIRSVGETYNLKRRGNHWQVESNQVKDRADPAVPEKIADLASGLFYYNKIPASEIQQEENLAQFGLRSSKKWVEFHSKDWHRLLLGKETAIEGRIYARLDGSQDVFVIDEELSSLLTGDISKLRARTLTDLDPAQTDKVILRTETGEIELVRSHGSWRLSKPLSAPADATTVERFLTSFFQMPIEDFVSDDSGDLGTFGILEGESEIAVFVDGQARPMVLRFGHTPPEFPDSVLAQFTRRDVIARVPAVARTLLDVYPDDFRDRRLLPVQIDTVDLIRIDGPDHGFELRRKGDGWELETRNGKIYPASPAAIARLVDVLSTAEVKEFSRDSLPGDEPVTSVRFFSVLSENTPEAAVGIHPVAGLEITNINDAVLSVAVEGQPGSSRVESDILVALPKDHAEWILPVDDSKEPTPAKPGTEADF